MNSEEAKTKGFVLDLHFYKIPDIADVMQEESKERRAERKAAKKEARLAAIAKAEAEAAEAAANKS